MEPEDFADNRCEVELFARLAARRRRPLEGRTGHRFTDVQLIAGTFAPARSFHPKV